MPSRRISCLACVLLLVGSSAHAGWASPRAQKIVRETQAAAPDIPAQALALARLAWSDGERDLEAAALAREKLVGYGEHGYAAMFDIMDQLPMRFKADVTAALLVARRTNRGAPAQQYFSALDRAVWFGSRGARRLAIPELARYRVPTAMLPSIDAAYEDPALTRLVIRVLPAFGQAGARFFLHHMLLEGSHEHRVMAAQSLARIGGRAIETLRDATLSERREVRETAIEALLPGTGVNDLTTIHEYVALHPDDDPDLLQRIRERAIHLEALLEQAQQQDAAGLDDH